MSNGRSRRKRRTFDWEDSYESLTIRILDISHFSDDDFFNEIISIVINSDLFDYYKDLYLLNKLTWGTRNKQIKFSDLSEDYIDSIRGFIRKNTLKKLKIRNLDSIRLNIKILVRFAAIFELLRIEQNSRDLNVIFNEIDQKFDQIDQFDQDHNNQPQSEIGFKPED